MRTRSALLLLLCAALSLSGFPGAHALFGLRGGKESAPPASAANLGSQDTTDGAPPASPGSGAKAAPARQADPADPYPYPPSLDDLQDYEAWEDGKGELHMIRAQRIPAGDFIFPEGTIVSASVRCFVCKHASDDECDNCVVCDGSGGACSNSRRSSIVVAVAAVVN